MPSPGAPGSRFELLGQLVDSSPVLVLLRVPAPDLPVTVFLSDNVHLLTGYTAEDFLSARVSWAGIVHPEDRSRVKRETSGLVSGEADRTFCQYRLVNRGGETVWVDEWNRLVRDETGRPVRIEATITDITPGKGAADASLHPDRLLLDLRAVRDLSTTLRLCLDAALRASRLECGGIYLTEKDGGMRLAVAAGLGREFLDAVGYYLPDSPNLRLVMDGKPVYAVHPDLKVPLGKAQLSEGLRAMAVIPILQEDRVLGCLNVASHRVEELSPDQQMALESIASQLGILITRSQADEALSLSEAQYRAIVEDQTDVIGRFRPDGTFTFVNGAYCRFFGESAADLIGDRWETTAVAEDLPAIKAALQGLSPAKPVVSIENRVYSGSGEVRWMHFSNRGIFDAEGMLIEVQFVGRDITDRKRAELALRESQNRLQEQHGELEQKNAALRELLEQLSAEKARVRADVAANVEDVIRPLIKRLPLKGASRKYIQVLERHLSELTSSYSRSVVKRIASELTPRETEICDMVKAGLSTREIADLLGVSFQTVQRHRRNVRRRLHLTGRKQNLASFLASAT